jgi:hypothetical protein
VPEKGSNPRVFNTSTKLAVMLNNLPKKSEKIFGYRNVRYLERLYNWIVSDIMNIVYNSYGE